MPKCHDGWSALSVSAFGTCFATFRKPSSIMQSFVIASSLATKKCSSKSRNTKLCATPRKQWIYEKLHYTPTTQRRELKKTSLILKRWRLVQNNSILSSPKGLRTENTRAVTGRQCSWEEDAFLTRRPSLFYNNGHYSETKSWKIDPKVRNEPSLRGL